MTTLLAVIRAELRRRWRGLVLVALLIGLAGGASLAAFAGARRTSSAFDRFLAWSRSQDVVVLGSEVTPDQVERVRALPDVRTVGAARFLGMAGPDGQLLAGGAAFAPLDDVFGREVYRSRAVAGRAPSKGAADEIAVSETFAREQGLHLGDRLGVTGYTQEQFDGARQAQELGPPAGPHVELRIVGVTRSPDDLNLQASSGGVLVLPRAFLDAYGDRIGSWYGAQGAVLGVRLVRREAGVTSFVSRLDGVLSPGSYDIDPVALTRGGVQESIDLLARAAFLFGLIVSVAGLIAVGLTIARRVALLGSEYSSLRELGLTPRWRMAAAAAPVLLAALVGVVVAVAAAWAASPLFPFGLAGDAEPHPGVAFDPLVLLGGGAVIVVAGATLAAGAAWRAVKATASPARSAQPSRLRRAVEAAGMPPPVAVGVRMALEPGSGRTAAPVRSALAGTALAVLGVVAVLVFGASLDHLLATPSARGTAWDAAISDSQLRPAHADDRCGAVDTRLLDDRDVDAVAMACSANITVGDRGVGAVGITPLRGAIGPTVLEGRAPSAPDEVALGGTTLAALGLHIGDRATVRTRDGPFEYRVVGRVVVPRLVDPEAIADGGVFTGAGFDRMPETEGTSDSHVVVRFRRGVDVAAAEARIEALPGIGDTYNPGVVPAQMPVEVARLKEVDRAPAVLMVLLGLLGALAVGHLLVTSIRLRRRDLALLKCLGFRRRQLAATVASQALTVAALGLVAGLVGGLAAGAAFWRATAHDVGVVATVDRPAPALLLVAAVTLAVAGVVAVLPARRAARLPTATVLRAE